MIKNVMNDVEEIKKLSKIDGPSKITLFVTPKWKYDVYSAMLDQKELKELMKDDELKKYGKSLADYYKRLQKKKPLEDIFMTYNKENEKFQKSS